MTDIVATISPLIKKTELINAIKQCNNAGIKKIRINIAKIYDDKSKKKLIDNIFFIRNNIEESIILIDCAYPRNKSRIHINNYISIKKNNLYMLKQSNKTSHNDKIISIDYVSKQLIENEILFYGDGEGGFKIRKIMDNRLIVQSICDFVIYNSKTITKNNFPSSESYINFLLSICNLVKPEEMAFSFVEENMDLDLPKELKKMFNFSIVSKIETDKGVQNIKNILFCSDKIMIGRGDLGLCSDINKLYYIQTNIFMIAKQFNKSVYIATDILESLNRRCIPSRADIIDASILIESNPDCIILNYSIINNNKLVQAVNILRLLEKNI